MNRVELPEVSVSHTMAPYPMSEAEFLAWQDPLPNPLELLKELAVI